MTALSAIDLTDVDLFVSGEYHEAFAALRRERPVHWNATADGGGFWALTRYDDVLWAYRDHTLFGSEKGAILGGSFRSDTDTAAGKMLVATDLPRHRQLKQQIHPALASHVAARVTERVRGLLDRAVDRLLAAGGGDFAVDVAPELPAGALMEIMGIGYADARRLIGLTRGMVGFRDASLVDTADDERLRLAWLQAEVFEFFEEVVADRRVAPKDDLVSTLLAARVNGRRLTDEEIFYNCMNVAVGGNETSSHTACAGMLALVENRGSYDLLLAAPGHLEAAVEEILRWSSTNAYVQRVAKRDVERRGRRIRAGDSVTLWNCSANRDEEHFPDAHVFDITRSPNRHLSYGGGIHRCIGAPVAQLELSAVFERVLLSGARLDLAGEPVRLRSNFILGMTGLPLKAV
ncbi:MAG: cytochrome P450 [Streptomycetaceae bacterium]|nr:cytochrome P450 [Streptomycetaceae bacterium]